MSALMWYCAVPAGVPRGGLLAGDRPPRVQRADVADLPRPFACRVEQAAAEAQHLLGAARVRMDEEGDDVDLGVPEVVALVAAPGHALGGYAEALAAGRRLQELEQVEAHRCAAGPGRRTARCRSVARSRRRGDGASPRSRRSPGRPPGRASGRPAPRGRPPGPARPSGRRRTWTAAATRPARAPPSDDAGAVALRA